MALEHPCPSAGDIGDREADPEPEPDRFYEQEAEKRAVNERTQADSGWVDR